MKLMERAFGANTLNGQTKQNEASGARPQAFAEAWEDYTHIYLICLKAGRKATTMDYYTCCYTMAQKKLASVTKWFVDLLEQTIAYLF